METETSCSVCGQRIQVLDGVVEQETRCSQCNSETPLPTSQVTIQWNPDQPPPPLTRELPNPNSTAAQSFDEHVVEVLPALPAQSPRVRDEWDDVKGPGRRSLPEIDLTYASMKVRRSANALSIIAGINLAIVLYRGLHLILWADAVASWTNWHIFFGLLTLGPDLLQMATSVFVLFSVGPMKRLKRFELSRAAAIAAMLPFISFNCVWGIPLSLQLLTLVPLLGVPIGWRAFVVLGEPDVVIAFGQAAKRRHQRD